MKKVLAILLMLMMIVSAISCGRTKIPETDQYTSDNVDFGTVVNKDLEYELSEDGTYYTVKGIGGYEAADLVIPSVYKELPVTRIGENAFRDGDKLESVTIPDSVTIIGEKAFYACDVLKNITVDANNTEYKSIDGNLYTKDGKMLIQYATGKIETSFTVPDSVTVIGKYAFYACEGLVDITIGKNVELIDERGFGACTGIKSITIPSSVKTIGEAAFTGCERLRELNINKGVTCIGERAFGDCKMLVNLTVPDGVTRIGSFAFRGCDSLVNVSIPDSVTEMGRSAFWGCSEIRYTEYNNGRYLGNRENPYVVLVKVNDMFVTSFKIADTTKIIHDFAFKNSIDLISIDVPYGVTCISDGAFLGCEGLESITVPDSVTNIGDNVFLGCKKLKNITVDANNTEYKSIDGNLYTKDEKMLIQYATGKNETSFTVPENVTDICFYAFYSCKGLTRVTIGNGVTNISAGAFEDCLALTDIDYKGTKAQWNDLEKYGDWDSKTGEYVVHCSDGDIPKAVTT